MAERKNFYTKEQLLEQRERTVGILIFNDVEVLDFAGPFEVFSVARQVGQHNQGQQGEWNIIGNLKRGVNKI